EDRQRGQTTGADARVGERTATGVHATARLLVLPVLVLLPLVLAAPGLLALRVALVLVLVGLRVVLRVLRAAPVPVGHRGQSPAAGVHAALRLLVLAVLVVLALLVVLLVVLALAVLVVLLAGGGGLVLLPVTRVIGVGCGRRDREGGGGRRGGEHQAGRAHLDFPSVPDGLLTWHQYEGPGLDVIHRQPDRPLPPSGTITRVNGTPLQGDPTTSARTQPGVSPCGPATPPAPPVRAEHAGDRPASSGGAAHVRPAAARRSSLRPGDSARRPALPPGRPAASPPGPRRCLPRAGRGPSLTLCRS